MSSLLSSAMYIQDRLLPSLPHPSSVMSQSSKTVEPTPEIVDPTAETTTTEPAVESVSTAPQSVPKKQESTVDVVAKDLEAVKIAEQPAVTET